MTTALHTRQESTAAGIGAAPYFPVKQIGEYYRLAEPGVQFFCDKNSEEDPGFFAFGDGAVCFGQCSAVPVLRSLTHPLPDTLKYAQVSKNCVRLPFNADDVVGNLRNERYTLASPARRADKFLRDIYYRLRPRLGVAVRKYLQRAYLSGWQRIPFPSWPVDLSVDRIMERSLALGLKAAGVESMPFIWFWPNASNSCAIITHDVETAEGRDFCPSLMDIDDSCGMKAAFQVIPEHRYEVPASFLNGIRDRGFEVNVHDLNHDGMLFSDEETFMQRVGTINQYGKQFGSRGFRSGIMYRNQAWFHALDFEYEMSVPNVAHLEPQRGGCCTVMPYFIGNILELPLTTTQDYTLFHILGERSLNIWEQEIDAVHRNHGLISVLVHPDYITEPWAQHIYVELLRHIAGRAASENIWLATPGEVNDWWRTRSKLSLALKDEGWQILGEGGERARIAYASLDGDNVRYSFDPPATPTMATGFGASSNSGIGRPGAQR